MENFKANRKNLNRQNSKTTLKLEKTSGRYKVASIIGITLNLEFNSTCRKNKHALTPLKYIDVSWSRHIDLDVMQEKRIEDYWNVDMNRSLSDSLTRFTKILELKEMHPIGIYVVWGETDKSSDDSRTRSCVARCMDQNWKVAQKRED